MAEPRTGNIERQNSEAEHIGPIDTGDNISAKRVANYAFDVASGEWKRINTKTLGTQLTTDDAGQITNSIIHGRSSAGGGTYVDVKVTPSGALVTETTTATLTERYDIQGTTMYVGEASVGTAQSATGWTITKYDLSDLTDASGKVAENAVWDDRTTETYS